MEEMNQSLSKIKQINITQNGGSTNDNGNLSLNNNQAKGANETAGVNEDGTEPASTGWHAGRQKTSGLRKTIGQLIRERTASDQSYISK